MFESLIIITCLAVNAILSCFEMAFITVSKAHVKKMAELGNASAKRLLQLKINPERTLSIIQIGITLVGALSAAVAGAEAEKMLSSKIALTLGVAEQTAIAIAIIIVVVPLTYVSVVIGELAPKSIALKFPLKIALTGSYFLFVLDRFFYPFVIILESSTKFLTKYVFRNFKSESALASSGEVDLENLTDSHKQYVFNLINVDKRTVKDVMVQWDQVTTVNQSDHHHEILEKIKASRHTRMPVIGAEGKVIGLLHSKEFVSETEVTKLDWKQLIRSVITVSPKEHILNALKKLQSKKSHLGVIMQDGVTIGIVTIEDIFEEVVGEIYDEDDEPNTLLSTNSRIRTMNLGRKE